MRDETRSTSSRLVLLVDNGKVPGMAEDYRPFKPCIYPSVCADCNGLPDAVAVHLVNGERLEFSNVAGIELTAEEIVLHPEAGAVLRFARSQVVYAGCARVLPSSLA